MKDLNELDERLTELYAKLITVRDVTISVMLEITNIQQEIEDKTNEQ